MSASVTFEKSRRKRYGACGDVVAEKVGFEPTCLLQQHDFESRSL